MAGKLQTTVIGSFSKLDYLPIRDWCDSARENGTIGSTDVTLGYTGWKASEADKELFRWVAEELVGLQFEAGVDVPTDGEVRRENYIHYHCRHIAGFDFRDLERRVLRDSAYEAELPAIRGKVSHDGPAYSPRDFAASQEVSARAVKFALPGPLTIMDTTADCHYDDRSRLAADLAATVNKEILALVDAGCRHIQVDEPLFARQVEDGLGFLNGGAGALIPQCAGPCDARGPYLLWIS